MDTGRIFKEFGAMAILYFLEIASSYFIFVFVFVPVVVFACIQIFNRKCIRN